MTYLPAQYVFHAAMKERRDKYPLVNGGAYKVRESRDNLQRECAVVDSIAEYLSARPGDRHSGILLGCTSEDKAQRLKGIPRNIAHDLGYDLIPAVEALALEGVPAAAIANFLASIRPAVDQLLADCDAVQTGTARSIKAEYAALKHGGSGTERICANALRIADQAVAFCERHGVYRDHIVFIS